MNHKVTTIALVIALSSTSVYGKGLFLPTIDSFLTDVAPHWTSVVSTNENAKVKLLQSENT